MTAKLTEDRLLAYFEGTLSESDARDVAQLVEQDPQAQALLADWQAQNDAIATLFAPAADDPVPAHLSAITRAAPAPRLPRAGLQVAAGLALVMLGGTGGYLVASQSAPQGLSPIQAALSAHDTYVTEVLHPVEVSASEEDHLIGWIGNRIGTQIDPPDFNAQGFALLGGRVLPSDSGAAAQFMYENLTGQRVTLYLMRSDTAGETAFQFTERDGLQGFVWVDDGLSYAVIGDIGRDHLRRIALEAYDQLI